MAAPQPGPTPPLPPPPPLVEPVVGAVLVVVVVVVVEVVEVVEVVGVVEDAVDVVVAVVAGVVVAVVDVGVAVDAGDAVVVDDAELPLSEAITASATPSPITTATSRTIAAFIPVLMPPPGGGSSPGSLITRVGSSCIGGASLGCRPRSERACEEVQRPIDVLRIDHQRRQEPEHPGGWDVDPQAVLEPAGLDRDAARRPTASRSSPSGALA